MKISLQSIITLLHNIMYTVSPERVWSIQRTTIISAYLSMYCGCEDKTRRNLFLTGTVDDISAIADIPFLKVVTNTEEMLLLQMARDFERLSIRARSHQNVAHFLAQSGPWPESLVDALKKSANDDSFWLRLSSPLPGKVLNAISPLQDELLDHNDLLAVCPLIATIIAMHSEFTARHSADVAKMAQALAAQYGLDPEMQIKIAIAGYLHDVGKMHIAREILEKKGQLEQSEFDRIKQHCVKTLELLTSVDELGDIARWAANHHERLDGSGYPLQLSASSLDIPSRIIAVADVFTALTEDRPYRAGMSAPDALMVILRDAKNNRLDKVIVAMLEQKINKVSEF